MNIDTIGTRVRTQRDKLGLTQQALARKAGVSQGLIGQLEKGINQNSRHTVALARALEVSPDWLADGKDTGGLTVYQHSPRNHADNFDEDADYIRVQHLDVSAGMGGAIVNDDHPDVIGEMLILRSYLRSILGFVPAIGRLGLITGKGDSMAPTIEPGELLLIDSGVTYFAYDAVYAINLGNGVQVKRLADAGKTIQVRSDNPLYPSFDLPETAQIVGKVILRNRLERLG